MVLERGPHHRVVEWVNWLADATGQQQAVTNRYTELATGLHYWRDGQWVDSQELVEPTPDGAIAVHGQHSVAFAANANTAGAVDLAMPDGQHLSCHVLGLRYWDPATNSSVWLATLTNADGEVHPPNRVVYPTALRGQVTADLGYTWTKAAFEQEVILRTALPDPGLWGMNRDTVWLQAVTEFLEPPEPAVIAAAGGGDGGDVLLDFGSMQMARGWAFALGSTGERSRARVSKQWVTVEGRRLLLESVRWAAIDAEWKGLTAAVRPAAGGQGLPPNAVPQLPVARTAKAATGGGPLKLARNDRRNQAGFVLDWTALNGTHTNVTLKGDTTYYVSGAVYLRGTNNWLEGGTVAKFTNTVSAQISAPTLQCATAPYRPAVFTSKDDDSVGEGISGSTGSPTNYYAYVALSTDSNLQYVRVSHARTGIVFTRAGQQQTLRHAQLVHCQDALRPSANEVVARNLLIHGVNNVVFAEDSGLVRGEHWTVHNANNVTYSDYAVVYLTNSLLVAVTNANPSYVHCTVVSNVASDSGVFETVWAGSHYLAANTEYRNKGTTNINADLRAELALMTTYPPEVVSNHTYTNHFHWTRQIARDDDQPDLGYHYQALDYAATGVQVTNATLQIDTGTAVAMAGSVGVRLLSNAGFVSAGSPFNLNHIVRYQAVQEQSCIIGTNSASMALLCLSSNPDVLPAADLRFTDISLVADSDARRAILYNATYYQLDHLWLSHCQLRGATLSLSLSALGSDYRVMTVALTNTLAERFNFSLDQEGEYPKLVVLLHNNLFRNGSLHVADYIPANTFRVYDNLFDTMTLGNCEGVPNGTNGYVTISHLPGSSGGDKDITLPVDYQAGPLGNYYYPTTGGNLSQLIDHGSRPASAADLYLYTALANQTPEGSTTVDIGFHYVPQVQLLTVTTNLSAAVDVDYHPPTQGVTESLIVSVNFEDGYPSNIARVDTNANVTYWSGVSNNWWENPLTTAKSTGYGFLAGETFFGTESNPAQVWRISADGSSATQWVTLNDVYWPGGLYIDQTGLFGHDLLLVTGWLMPPRGGSVWRINGQTGAATNIVDLGTCLEGVLVCPTNASKYGPWAGKLLTGAGDQRVVYYVAPDGTTNSTDLGLSPHDFHIIPSGQDLYCVSFVSKDTGPSKLVKIPSEFFANVLDDILIVQSGEFHEPICGIQDNGELFLVHWDGTNCLTHKITDGQYRWLEHAVFAPVSLPTQP